MQISLNYRFLIALASVLAAFSAVLNFALVQLLWAKSSYVPLWGPHSIAMHFMAFSILYGFILSWLATKATRKALQTQRVLPLHWHLKSQTVIDRLPSSTFSRSFMLGLYGAAISGIMLYLMDLKALYFLNSKEFLILSSLYAICFSVAITTMAVYRALGDRVFQKAKV
ncbi:hypothetical protein [Pontibacter oryzae]|uniref:Uncharacterized protein n=1 Tax=Pontibacter oryzae TaxID=2304593 RepID=A0A399SHT0_9BACT|nr:hypothetical protein [Pontibacter oryzae]RIJ41652.1 hypothetical protein D1627_06390 [Pontibacter oryzae]